MSTSEFKIGGKGIQISSAGTVTSDQLTVIEGSDDTKQLILSVSAGATTSTSTTLEVSQTSNQTITFPDSTGTLTTLEGTEPLTNKTIIDSSNNVTARALFSNSGVNTISSFAAANPTNGQVLTATSATTANWQTPSGGGGGGNINSWIISDVKSAGTNGGTFTQSAWRTRDLNTIESLSGAGTEVQVDVSPASTNQLRIENGSYWVYGVVPADGVDEHKARLQNITDGVTELNGTSIDTRTSRTCPSTLMGYLVVNSGPKVYEVQHQCFDTRTNFGFGVASGFGAVEVYTTINFVKIS